MYARLSPVLFALLPTLAFAQDVDPAVDIGFNAHDLQIAAFDGDVRDPLLLQRPDYMERGDFWFGGMYEYANEPLVRYTAEGNEASELLRFTSGMHVNTGIVLDERLRLDASVPIFFNVRDEDGIGTRGALGDVAITGLISLIAPDAEDDGLGLGVTTRVSLPTGAEQAGLGEEGTRIEPGVAATYATGPMTFTGNLGLDIRSSVPARGGYDNPNRITTGVAAGYAFSPNTGVTLEGRMAAPLSEQPVKGQATPAEILLTGRQNSSRGLHFVGGGALGVGPGVGTAEWRVFAGLGVTRRQGMDMDPDNDGILGDADACPNRPETFNNYNDLDGCPDELAAVDVVAMGDGGRQNDAMTWVMMGEQTYATPLYGIMPGESATGYAEYGCAAGSAEQELVEGDNDIQVRLRAEREYTVNLDVIARDGTEVGDVTATWRDAQFKCVEDDTFDMQGASGSEMVGDKPLELSVSAEGFRPVRLYVYGQKDWVENTRNYRVMLRRLRPDVIERQIEVTERILFDFDEATLRPESKVTLDGVAAEIMQAPDNARIEVEGHTDAIASDRYNDELSQRRAQTVVDYLVTQGVDADKLRAVGLGETEPVATNATPAGRQINRRVVFTVLTPKP